MDTYASVLRQAQDDMLSVDSDIKECQPVGLYFHGELVAPSFELKLLPPERANNRRIFRKFGSHRFLHVKVGSEVPYKKVMAFFTQKVKLCGRSYGYLWCKAQKSPQCFILFAEKGLGITKEITVEYVREWCIPISYNAGLTLAKELKRIKLAFSKTTQSYTLPANSLEIIPDIISKTGTKMTDGCGLISQDCLNYIWVAYCLATGKTGDSLCPFSSFQGRIGGYKGVWVLDDSLSNVKILCRTSQLKFHLPMESDDMYSTVDINSWDEKAEKGFLVSGT